jgi:hypothetical protein
MLVSISGVKAAGISWYYACWPAGLTTLWGVIGLITLINQLFFKQVGGGGGTLLLCMHERVGEYLVTLVN